MKAVWRELQRQKMDDAKLTAIPSQYQMETWGLFAMGVSPQDQACAAFYCCIVTELGVPKQPAMLRHVLKSVKPWQSAAALCRMAQKIPGHAPLDSEIVKALSIVAEYFDDQARFIEQANRQSPYFIKRSSGLRGVADDKIRGSVRAIARGMHAIFGSFLYGTLATTASVVLKRKIDAKKVENWCADLTKVSQ